MQVWIVAACAALFFAQDRFLRFGAAARSDTTQPHDRGSTSLNFVGIFAAAFAAFALPRLLPRGLGTLPSARMISLIGAALAPLGLAMRAWAVLTLRERYTRTLRIEPGQQLMDRGPYRLIRHPGYLGSLMCWTGVVLASANWISLVVGLPALYLAYAHRMASEEAMLELGLGDAYRAYRARTRRLIPFIY